MQDIYFLADERESFFIVKLSRLSQDHFSLNCCFTHSSQDESCNIGVYWTHRILIIYVNINIQTANINMHFVLNMY